MSGTCTARRARQRASRAPAACALALALAACAGAAPAPTAAVPPLTLPPAWTATPPGGAPRQTPTPAPLGPGEWARGPETAPVTLVVYCDFQAPGCFTLAGVVDGLRQDHGESLRVVYRQFPLLSIHDKAGLAAQAAEAAGAQGAFWQMHDLLYARWIDWVNLDPGGFRAWLDEAAAALSLDAARFRAELDAGAHAGLVEQAYAVGRSLGFPGAPFVYLNGELFRLNPDRANLEAAVRLSLLEPRRVAAYPEWQLAPGADYRARLTLDGGEVLIALYADDAPLAVNSFVFLARRGWFDGAPFHRVLPGVLVESGDPSGTGLGDPGYFFGVEASPALRFDRPGVVAMSAAAPGAHGSQWFITLTPMPELEGTHTIFGRVLSGLELLEALPARDPAADLLLEPAGVIRAVVIEEEAGS